MIGSPLMLSKNPGECPIRKRDFLPIGYLLSTAREKCTMRHETTRQREVH
jgi:hypothetical protein